MQIKLAYFVLITIGSLVGAEVGAVNYSMQISRSFEGQLPKWDRGHILSFDFPSAVVYSYDRAGREEFQTAISVPSAARIMIRDIAASPNGDFAIAATAVADDGAVAGVLVLLDHGGSISKIIRTSPVALKRLLYADDGILWAVSREFDANFKELPSHDLLRWYDRDGILLGHAVDRQSVSREKAEPAPAPLLAVSRDRIGFYADRANVWTEVSSQGQIIGQWRFPAATKDYKIRVVEIKLTAQNDVLVDAIYSYVDGRKSHGLYSFNRDTGTLRQLDTGNIGQSPVSLRGVDGNSLVLRYPAGFLWTDWVH